MSSNLCVILHGGAVGKPELSEDAPREAVMREALDAAWALLMKGNPGEEAVVAALRVLEQSEFFDAGYGSFLNEQGKVFLDAALMRGNGNFAALLNVTGLLYPSEVLLDMLRAGDFHMKVWNEMFLQKIQQAPLALQKRYGVVAHEKEMISPYAKMITDRHIAGLKRSSETVQASNLQGGTVGCVVRDATGKIFAGTSTGGTVYKPVGRIGDAAIIGAGTFAEDGLCGLSATGHGEAILRNMLSSFVVARIREEQRKDKNAFVTQPQILRTIIREELHELRRKSPGSGAALIIVPASGDPAYEFNSPGLCVAFRSGTASNIQSEEVAVRSQSEI